MKSSIRNEIKAQIIRAGYTMQEVVDQLHDHRNNDQNGRYRKHRGDGSICPDIY